MLDNRIFIVYHSYVGIGTPPAGRKGLAAGREPEMTFAGIEIIDTDSLEAAADLKESYVDYCARRADELAAENGIDPDDDTSDAAWDSYNPDRNDGLCLLVTVAATE